MYKALRASHCAIRFLWAWGRQTQGRLGQSIL